METWQETKHPFKLSSPILFSGLMSSGNILITTKNEVSILNKKDGYS